MRFVRTLVPCLAVLAVAPVRDAAAQSVSFGLMAGGSLSTFTGDFVEDAKNYGGFIGGGFARIGVAGFAIQPGVYYTSKGAKAEDVVGTADATTKLDYIQIPVVFRVGLGTGKTRFYVGAGPAIGIKIGCKITLQGASGVDDSCPDGEDGSPKSTEVSGIAEAGIEFGKFSIGARADLGLTNAFKAVEAGSTSDVKVRTRTLSAVAAIRF